MGAAGGSFAQGFVSTLMHGQQVMAQIENQREELELNKKLTAAKLQAHDAQTQLATKKLRAMLELDQFTQPTEWPDSEFGAGGQQAPPTMTPHDKLRIAAGLDPEGTARTMLAPAVGEADLEGMASAFLNGGARPAQAPQQATQTPEMAPPPPPPPGQAAPPAQEGAAVPDAPRMKQERSATMSIGSDGKRRLNLQIANKTVGVTIKEEIEALPNGRTQLWRTVLDADTGAEVARVPVGSPKMPDQLVKYAEAAKGWGLKPGTELYESAIADQAAAESTFSGRALDIKREEIADAYRRMATARPTGSAPPQITTDSPRLKAQAEEQALAKQKADLEVSTAGRRTAAEGAARTQTEMNAPIGDEAVRFLNKKTLASADPSTPKGKLYEDKNYVQIAPQQAQGIAYYKAIKDTLDTYDEIILRNPHLFPPSSGDAGKDLGLVAAAWTKWKAQEKTNEDIGRLRTNAVTLPGIVKSFGDTANVAVAERAQTESGLPLGVKTREQALAQVDQLRSLINSSTERYQLPPMTRRSGPKPTVVQPERGEPAFTWDEKGQRRIPRKP